MGVDKHQRGLTLIRGLSIFCLLYRLKKSEFVSSETLFLNYFKIIAISLAVCLSFSLEVLLILGLKLIRVGAYDPVYLS